MTDLDSRPPMDDADLRALLDRCLSDVQAPDGLHASALATGRRLRTRRRAGQLTGGLIAAACTAIVVTTLGGGDGSAGAGYAGDLSPTTAASPSPSPAPTVDTGVHPTPPPGWWDMPSRRMLTVLEDVLPEGVSVEKADLRLEGTTQRERATGHLNGVLTAASGPGAFQVLLYPPDPLPEPVPSTAAESDEVTTTFAGSPPLGERMRCQSYMASCEPVHAASGAVIGRVTIDEEGGTTYYEVMLLGPDGGGLYFYVGDSSGEKPGHEPPSAEAPPLTTDELVAVAQDPAWTDYEPED